MALLLTSLFLAASASARGVNVITQAAAAITPGAERADCPLTNSVPLCGIPCLVSAAAANGCGLLDLACQCEQAADISSSASACLVSSCGAETATSVHSVAVAICTECVNVL
ncbi:hypothetical protein VTJ49DRAFT_6558 [Mycothermus thermophilus]|uniref:CFEM domain-containing protein n=1 Tax=Humicola insolens TaxID=85995 RepID=A0ABR3VJ31_HUMIN